MSSLWDRVGADPGALDAVSAAVDGREDALDLLWWAEHPGRPTPDGRPDPGPALERDRRALYRRAGGDASSVAAAAAVARHADHLARAIAAARAALDERPAPPPPPPVDGPPDAAVEALPQPPAERPRRPAVLATLVAGIALVVGVAVGAVAFGGGRADQRSAPEPTIPSFRIFERAQRPATDVPFESDAVPSSLDPSTVRRLRSYSTVGTSLYAARGRDDRVCLFVIVLGRPAPPACTTPAAFAAGGLSLIVRASADPIDDSGRRPLDELDITWNPDDTVSITPSGVDGSGTRAPSAS